MIDIQSQLQRYQIQPDARLGQNFLIDPQALQLVVNAADIHIDDLVLEVGAGLGSLTILLANQAHFVIAVEIDHRLFTPLAVNLQDCMNVRMIEGNILNLSPSELFTAYPLDDLSYKVVANIPYYITSNLLRHLLETKPPPKSLVLTVQEEVAERICAATKNTSLLTLSVQVYGNARIAARIPAQAFFPIPKVDSAVVRVDLFPQPYIPLPDLDLFFWLAKAGFSQKRKTLRNALSGGLHWTTDQVNILLEKVNIDPMRRAETLTLVEWKALVVAYKELTGGELLAT